MLCFHCMDKCKYGPLYPLFSPLLHTSFHRAALNVSLGHFASRWDLTEFMLYRKARTLLSICFCFTRVRRRGTRAFGLTYKLHNYKKKKHVLLFVQIKTLWFLYLLALKEQFACNSIRTPKLFSTCRHVSGSSDEVSQPASHFWSFASKLYLCIFMEN